jgi:hypothetical protein
MTDLSMNLCGYIWLHKNATGSLTALSFGQIFHNLIRVKENNSGLNINNANFLENVPIFNMGIFLISEPLNKN